MHFKMNVLHLIIHNSIKFKICCRWTLIPVIIARVLQTNPSDQLEEDKSVESKLLQTILDLLHESMRYRQFLVESCGGQRSSQSVISFTVTLLNHLKQCLKSIVVSFDGDQLKKSLLPSRNRAELLNVLIDHGDQLAEEMEEDRTQDWIIIRNLLLAMLTDE